MDNRELDNFRKTFFENVEKGFYEKHTMELRDYEDIIKTTVKGTKVSENTSNHIYVYMGSYAMKQGKACITYNNDSDLVYKKYRDIETENTITVNKASVDAFEAENRIIFSVVSEYTEEEYQEIFDMFRIFYFKQLLSSSDEKSFALIKRLTPLK